MSDAQRIFTFSANDDGQIFVKEDGLVDSGFEFKPDCLLEPTSEQVQQCALWMGDGYEAEDLSKALKRTRKWAMKQ